MTKIAPETLRAYIEGTVKIAEALDLSDEEFLGCQKLTFQFICEFFEVRAGDVHVGEFQGEN